jgi:predicted patatin/cPLA2 family phospholipase
VSVTLRLLRSTARSMTNQSDGRHVPQVLDIFVRDERRNVHGVMATRHGGCVALIHSSMQSQRGDQVRMSLKHNPNRWTGTLSK